MTRKLVLTYTTIFLKTLVRHRAIFCSLLCTRFVLSCFHQSFFLELRKLLLGGRLLRLRYLQGVFGVRKRSLARGGRVRIVCALARDECHLCSPNRGWSPRELWVHRPATHLLVCDGGLGFENFMLPKRRFWRAEQTFGNVFSKHFSNERSPNRVLTYVKSALKIRSRMFDRPCKVCSFDE